MCKLDPSTAECRVEKGLYEDTRGYRITLSMCKDVHEDFIAMACYTNAP